MPDTKPAPKKSLGQHFLHNRAICSRIVGLLDLRPQDQIIEIGPGPGALTSLLLQSPHNRLRLIEKDSYWAKVWGSENGAETLHMDALKYDWQSLGNEGQWKIIGNLPYNIASPLIWDITAAAKFERAVFMVQKEVGRRIAAMPGSRAYGAISVWTQCHARVKPAFNIGPGVFFPPPKVDSAVLVFERLPEKPLYPAALAAVLKICFQKRRKQIGAIFRGLPRLETAASHLGLDAKARPENLSCADFLGLAAFYANSPRAI